LRIHFAPAFCPPLKSAPIPLRNGTTQDHRGRTIFRSGVAASGALLNSRIKSDHEVQTIREMVGSKNSEWGATCIWHGRTPRDTLPATAQPFFLFSIVAGMVPPFSPFLLAILEIYGI
jgi:hypothetical protein